MNKEIARVKNVVSNKTKLIFSGKKYIQQNIIGVYVSNENNKGAYLYLSKRACASSKPLLSNILIPDNASSESSWPRTLSDSELPISVISDISDLPAILKICVYNQLGSLFFRVMFCNDVHNLLLPVWPRTERNFRRNNF